MRKINVISMNKLTIMVVSSIIMLISLVSISYYSNYKKINYENTVKIALISDTINGEPFIQQAYDELERLSQIYDFYWEYFPCERDVSKNSEHWEFMTREATKNKFDIIIGLGYKSVDIFEKVSAENTYSKYIVIDSLTNTNNYTSYAFNETESAYIFGAMIGKAFPDDELFGYISTMQNQPTYRYRYGFEQGLLSQNSDAKIIYEFINSNTDTEKAYDASIKLYEQGVNFIMGGASYTANLGIFNAVSDLAKEGKTVYTSGIGADQTTNINKNILGGLYKDTSKCINIIVEDFFEYSKEYEKNSLDTMDNINYSNTRNYKNYRNNNYTIYRNDINHKTSSNIIVLDIKDEAIGVIHIDKDGAYLNKSVFTEEVLELGKDLHMKFFTNELNLIAPDENI